MRGYADWVRTGAALCLAVQMAGCTEVQAVQDWISPPTPAQANARLREQAAQGHPVEALAAAETYLERHPAGAHELHGSMAQLYLAHGNAEAATRHLMQALAGPGPGPAPASAPRPEVRREAAPAPAPTPAPAPAPTVDVAPPAPFGAAVAGAAAQVLPDGSLSVRAGGVTAGTGNLSR